MSRQHCQSNRQLCRSPVHTSNNVEATLSNATSLTILSTKSNVALTLLPFFGNNVEQVSFVLWQCQNLFWRCWKDKTASSLLSTMAILLPQIAKMSKRHSTLLKWRNFTIINIVAIFGSKVECWHCCLLLYIVPGRGKLNLDRHLIVMSFLLIFQESPFNLCEF